MERKARGRPRIGELATFTVRPEQKRQIEALALQWDVTQSWVFRYCLDQILPALATNPPNPFATDGGEMASSGKQGCREVA
jgi:hypothetical protein